MVMEVDYTGDEDISKATLSNTLRKKKKGKSKSKRKKDCGCK